MTGDMLHIFIVPILIMAGWVVTACMAERMHKKNDRVALINKKNDMLRDLSQQAIKFWSGSGVVSDQEIDDLISRINKIISVYDELLEDHKDSIPAALESLRQTVTLDIDNKNSFTEDELKNKRIEIKRIIKELYSRPAKFKGLF